MDGLEDLERFRADRSAAEGSTERAREALDLAIERQQSAGARSREKVVGPSRRWIPAAGFAAAAVVVGSILLVSGSANEPTSSDPEIAAEPPVVYGDALLEFSNDSAADVVSHADQVAVVTAGSAVPISEEVPPEQAAADEGLTMRRMEFTVDDTLWRREGTPALDGKFSAIVTGWVEHAGEQAKFTMDGMPWIEEGSQYVMPLTLRDGKWTPELPLAIFPVIGSKVELAPTQDTPLAKALSGDALPEVVEGLRDAESKVDAG